MGETRIYGIRHHGPGSAKSLVRSLHSFQPSVILVEAPAEVEEVFGLASDPTLKPPVAILVYAVDDPKQAAFYPFAEFSPEWNALRFGASAGIPVRAIDLPASLSLAFPDEEEESDQVWTDPMSVIAEAAGYSDGEQWWEQTFEGRVGEEDPFEIVAELMTELRGHLGERPERREAAREAHMRLAIRDAASSFERVAVVCGAWHVSALKAPCVVGSDKALLKDLPKTKVAATWVPWTYERLAFASGYRAGVISPAYYEHLWASEPGVVAHGWLIRAAQLLREEGQSASTASVIEAVRLAETLACVRGRDVPGLTELIDAVLAVLTHSDSVPIRLIETKLIVGEKLGEIPEDTPSIPLASDLAAQQRRLRLKPEALVRELDLDLRNETDLARSQLLHRLNLLSIPWGGTRDARGKRGHFMSFGSSRGSRS